MPEEAGALARAEAVEVAVEVAVAEAVAEAANIIESDLYAGAG